MHMWLPAFRLPIRIRKSSPTWHELVYLCLFRLVSSWDSWFWLSDCLFVWLIDCLIGWFITWLITCMIVRVSKVFYTSMHVYLYGTHHVHSHPYRVGADSNEDLDPGVTSVRHCEMAGKNKVLFAGTMVCTAIYVPRGLWTLMSLGIESWLSYHVAGNTRGFFLRSSVSDNKLKPFQSRSLVWSLLCGFRKFALIWLRIKCGHIFVIPTESLLPWNVSHSYVRHGRVSAGRETAWIGRWLHISFWQCRLWSNLRTQRAWLEFDRSSTSYPHCKE